MPGIPPIGGKPGGRGGGGIEPIGGGTPSGGRGYPSGGRGMDPGAPMSASGGATPGRCMPSRPMGARPAVRAPSEPIAMPGIVIPMPLFCS